MDYYRDNDAFGGVFSRDNLPELKSLFYIVNLDDREGPGTHWVAIFNVGSPCIYFDSFGVDPPEEALRRMRQSKKKMIMNTYRIQELNSINCGFFCIYVVDELLGGRNFVDVLADFDPIDYNKNDQFIAKISRF